MSARRSGYDRASQDWYVEPVWCADNLFDALGEIGAIHDPCCGKGTIVNTALNRGVLATGADIADRANGRFPIVNFLGDEREHANIVTNPPYRLAKDIVAHAIKHVAPGGIVAVIVPILFLASQGRVHLFDPHWCDRVLVHSRRPSMPPGDILEKAGESARHSGSTDYCWLVFRPGRHPTSSRIGWLKP